MKIGVTINLGGYESLRVETSEYPNFRMCVVELVEALSKFKVEAVQSYVDTYLKPVLQEIRAEKRGREGEGIGEKKK